MGAFEGKELLFSWLLGMHFYILIFILLVLFYFLIYIEFLLLFCIMHHSGSLWTEEQHMNAQTNKL